MLGLVLCVFSGVWVGLVWVLFGLILGCFLFDEFVVFSGCFWFGLDFGFVG